MKTSAILVSVLLFCFSLVERPHAQTRDDRPSREQARERLWQQTRIPEIGVHGSYDFDAEDVGIGTNMHYPVRPFIRFYPGAVLYFGDEMTWQANADLSLGPPMLHGGGGLAVADGARFGGSGVDVGYNLFIGLQRPRGRMSERIRRSPKRFFPFAEARWTFIHDESHFQLAFGVRIPLR